MFQNYTEIFTERAREYHLAMTSSPHARDAEFRAVVDPIEDAPAGLVCDMPSGGCYLPPHLPAGMRYVGVEPVREFLNPAAEAHDIRVAPIDKVPLPDGSVDYVLSLAGLHHEESLVPVATEMRRLLRTGGRAVIADGAVDTGPARFLNGFVAANNPLGHDGRFLNDETGRVLDAAGLTVLQDEFVSVPWVFDSYDEVAVYCGSLFGIGSAGKERIVEGLDREIGFTEADGRIYLGWTLRRFICEAV